MRDNILLAVVTAGLLLIAVGIAIPLVATLGGAEARPLESDIFRYIYSAGAVMLLAGRIMSPYKGSNTRVKRLSRIETWGALFFCVAAFMLFYDRTMLRDPLAFTLAGGMIQVYTSIMIPRESKKQ